jgi:hypothetical protein
VSDLHHSEPGTGDPPALLIHGTGPAIWEELPALLAEPLDRPDAVAEAVEEVAA